MFYGLWGLTPKSIKGRDSVNALEELEQILLNESIVEAECEDLIRLNSLAEKVTAAIDGEVVSSSRSRDQMGINLANKENLKAEIARLWKEYERHRAYIFSFVKCLRKPVHITILSGVYFSGKELKEVSDEIGYSYRHTQDLRDVAIQDLQKIMDKSETSHKIS